MNKNLRSVNLLLKFGALILKMYFIKLVLTVVGRSERRDGSIISKVVRKDPFRTIYKDCCLMEMIGALK